MTMSSPVTYAALTPDTEEVRLATTMTGGVSLAVWMGGVTRELDLLLQASRRRRSAPTGGVREQASTVDVAARDRDLYGRLIGLLDVVVDVDILSGTSAGGINAVLLAYGRVRNVDLGGLRELWLELGALLDLLRSPTDTDVNSLLYGDRRLLRDLDDTLRRLGGGKHVPEVRPPTTLYVTTTLLTGETNRFTDALGTLVQNSDQHGLFTFTEDDLATPGIEGALAVAGRSTSSFPGAFEPAYVPYDVPTPKRGEIPARPPMRQFANITRSHWVADGGLLNNQPLDVILDRVFDQAAQRPVRRVLLYVVPSAGPAPDPTSPVPGDDVAEPYGLMDGLLKDLSAATSQSITAELRAISTHNDAMDARRDLRTQLAAMAGTHRLLSPSLLGDYLARAGEAQARKLVTVLLRVISTWPRRDGAARPDVPPDWSENLTNGGSGEEECRDAMRATLTSFWSSADDAGPRSGAAALPMTSSEFARYGQGACDNGKSIALAVAKLAYQVAATKDEREQLAECVHAIHGSADAGADTDLVALVTGACRAATVPSDEDGSARTLEQTAVAIARDWARQTVVSPHAWSALATAVHAKREIFRLLANGSTNSELATLVAYLGLNDPATTAHQVAERIFDLALAEQAMLPVGAGPYQPVELVQLSADTRSLLTPNHSTAGSKLTGLQFHHFGAFYKRSWRANDWAWGRVDAAGWLVHALLQPSRLRAVAQRSGAPDKVRWLVNELKTFGAVPLRDPWSEETEIPTENDIKQELAFVNDPSLALPRSVPTTSMWLATAWQQNIAIDEVHQIADAVLGADGVTPDRSPAASVAWAKRVREPGADPVVLLDECPVSGERLAGDRGTPLMLRTITKASATTSAAVASMPQVPGPVKPSVSAIRTVSLSSYRLAAATKGVARSFILGGLVLLVVGVLAATQSGTVLGVSGLIAAATGGYAVTIGAWQRSSRLVAALLAVTVVAGIASLTATVVRRGLFGTSSDDPGLVGRHVHWLATAWWHPLIVVGIVTLIVTVLAAAGSAGRGTRRTRA